MIKDRAIKQTIVRIFIFLTLCFLLQIENISGQGPNAPEAASFEPIDGTDMVNLVTGDFTYTIPVIEIPGPNGGYPLTLSYHAGIAMDQEASWVGLGWSLNPGAINRNLNGFPDDWNNVKTHEYYWNVGGSASQNSVDVLVTIYGVTYGLGASWGSLRGFSGSVTFGYGPFTLTAGNEEISVGLGINNLRVSVGMGESGFNAGVGLSTRERVSAGIGVGYSEGSGFNGSVGLYGTTKLNNKGTALNGSVGYSTSGVISYGLGASLATIENKTYRGSSGGAYFSTSYMQDDITIKYSGFTIPLIVINYRYEKVRWYANALKELGVSGPLYRNSVLLNIPQNVIEFCEDKFNATCYDDYGTADVCSCIEAQGVGYGYTGSQTNPSYAFLDVLEMGGYSDGGDRFSILNNNAALLNFDGFNVSGQGMSGNMSLKIFKSIPLINVNHDFEEADLQYFKAGRGDVTSTIVKFHFDNELTSGIMVNSPTFNEVSNPTDFSSYVTDPNSEFSGVKRNGNFVEYFTYKNLPSQIVLPNGFTKPETVDEDTIVGFKITSTDGMTYFYLLPVYSIFEKARNVNYQEIDNDEEKDKYFEKTNASYATHWLLTAVIGPDYVDTNSNGLTDEADYGYWVNFEYGKWSDGMVWRNPSDLEKYTRLKGNRRYSWGMKELYYLDKISTKTHTALFIKNLRKDNKGVPQLFIYKDLSGNHLMPSQKSLKLDKIVLIKNSELPQINKINSEDLITSPHLDYSFYEPRIDTTYNFTLNQQNNIIDIKDSFLSTVKEKALKVIDFTYDYQLAENAPNTDGLGKLTLTELDIKGKSGVNSLPPYRFNYSNNPNWEFDKINYWGYYSGDATAWSLDEIQMPQGNIIQIVYESDEYDINGIDYAPWYKDFRNVTYEATSLDLIITADVGNYDLKLGDIITVDFNKIGTECVDSTDPSLGYNQVDISYLGTVELVAPASNQTGDLVSSSFIFMILEPNNYSYSSTFNAGSCSNDNLYEYLIFKSTNNYKNKNFAGIRVKDLLVSDGVDRWKTSYEYSLGSVPYEPYYNSQGIPYQVLYRAPNVLYDKVTVKNYDKNNQQNDDLRSEYEFITDKTFIDNTIPTKKLFISNSGTSVFESFNSKETRAITYEIKDYQAYIGNLKSMIVYNGDNILSKSINNYIIPEESTGFINSQATEMYKSVNPKPNQNWGEYNYLISTEYIRYPVVLESTTSIGGGFSSTTYFNERDLNTGQLLETTKRDSKGNLYKTKSIPAYTILEYSDNLNGYGMGSKVDDVTNKNMLSQQAASYTYLLNETTSEEKVIRAGITTWNNDWIYRDESGVETSTSLENEKIWRKHKSYVWKGGFDNDGAYNGFNMTNDDDFNWGLNVVQSNSKWKNVITTTRYDHYSMSLESKDINGNYAAVRMGDQNSKVMATSNAKYTEMYFSGAEYISSNPSYFDCEIKATGQNTIKSHTGKYSVMASSGQAVFDVNMAAGEHRAGSYKISVWADKENYSNARININGSSIEFNGEEIFAGDWVLLYHYVDFSADIETVSLTSNSGDVYYDDFRLLPVASTMTSYVYNKWDELSYILGTNNLATHFRYNDTGQLCKIYTEVADTSEFTGGFKLIKENNFNYKDSDPTFCACCDVGVVYENVAIAKNDQVTIEAYESLSIDVLINDTFGIDGPSVGAITILSQATNGTAVVNNNGTSNDPTDDKIDYTAPNDIFPSDSFQYQICDADGDCDMATVTVNINVPPSEVYLSNIVYSYPAETIMRLHGVPGSTITYTVGNGNDTDPINIGDGTVIVNGVSTIVYGTNYITDTVVIPASGYVDCSIKHFTGAPIDSYSIFTLLSTTVGSVGFPYQIKDYDQVTSN